LPDAENVPVAELGHKLDRIGAKDRPIVVYCRSGARSAVAKSILESGGFQKVANLGAMSRW
jgi:rhodanese-related sulfurtransferase